MAKVVHLKKDCISCGACAAIAPQYWELDAEGLAQLKESLPVENHWEKEIPEQEIPVQEEAANVCPVQIIHVKKK
ncbi:TPA: ferredoxin [Candidatus Woesearchaeota archaeon]|nr:ferredoxin [Candidatus Woesearchaeota archaeon]